VDEFTKDQLLPLLSKDQLSPIPFNIWVRRYPAWRQKQLTEARARLAEQSTIDDKDLIIKCFIKNETSVSMTDPRNISPRSDEILATVGPWISAIEKSLKQAPFLVKGMNLSQRDAMLRRVLPSYSVYVETDYSRFDMTLSEYWLQEVQNRMFSSLLQEQFHHESRLFLDFLSRSTKIVGRSRSGHSYRIRGTRCSGDAHTSIGNGLVNKFNTWLCLYTLPPGTWTSVHEGDDGIICVSDGFEDTVVTNLDLLNQCGFKVKMVVSRDITKISFCGRKFSDAGGFHTYADISRTLSKFNTTTSHGDLRMLLRAKALSYHYTDAFTPIIGPLCRAIIHITRDISVNSTALLAASRERYLTHDQVVTTFVPQNVNENLRVAVSLTSGISISQQLAMEKMFSQWADIGFIPEEFPRLSQESSIEEPDRSMDLGETTAWFFH